MEKKHKDLIRHTKRVKDCLFWSRGKTGYGYGVFYRKRDSKGVLIQELVHRVSWELFNNKQIPKGMCVCHSCDNKLCIKGEHLWIGTQSENIQDAYDKKRKIAGFGVGEQNCNAKIGLDTARKLRKLYKTGDWSQKELGSLFRITQSNVGYIIRNKTWKHA